MTFLQLFLHSNYRLFNYSTFDIHWQGDNIHSIITLDRVWQILQRLCQLILGIKLENLNLKMKKCRKIEMKTESRLQFPVGIKTPQKYFKNNYPLYFRNLQSIEMTSWWEIGLKSNAAIKNKNTIIVVNTRMNLWKNHLPWYPDR